MRHLVAQLSKNVTPNSVLLTKLGQLPEFSAQYIEYRLCDSPQLDYLYCIDTRFDSDFYPLCEPTKSKLNRIQNQWPELPFFWVEHDDICNDTLIAPGLHACVAPDYLKNLTAEPLDKTQVLAVISKLCNHLPIGKEALLDQLEVIQQTAELIHVSSMHSRTPASIKLFVKVKPSNLQLLLEKLNWNGNFIELQNQLNKPWFAPDPSGNLSLDIKIDGTSSSYLALVHSKIRLYNQNGKDQDGIDRLITLIEQSVITDEQDINAVMAWLDISEDNPYSHWIDLKTIIDESNTPLSKLYFGCQRKDFRAQAKQ